MKLNHLISGFGLVMRKKGNITTKFMVIVSLLTLLLIAVLSLVTVSTAVRSQSRQVDIFIESLKHEQSCEEQLLREKLSQKGESLAALLAQTGMGLIVSYDFETLDRLVQDTIRDPDIEFVIFYDGDEKPIAQNPASDSDRGTDRKEGIETIRQEIVFEEELTGFVEIGLNLAPIRKTMNDISARIENLIQDAGARRTEFIRSFMLKSVISAGVGIVLISGFILFIFRYFVSRHLNTMAQYAQNLDLNHLETSLILKRSPFKIDEPDELEVVVRAHAADILAKNTLVAGISERPKEIEYTEDREKTVGEEVPPERICDGELCRILAVDDEPVNLQVLRNQLTSEHYSVTLAADGREAIAALEGGQKFDLVLLDVMMPGMSGYEVCQRLRERHPENDLPVVMLTAKNQIDDLVAGFDSGASDYLTKPFSKQELIARIETHITLKYLHMSRMKAETEAELLSQEMEIARRIQTA